MAIKEDYTLAEIQSRNARQESIFDWCEAAFSGEDTSPRIRALRLVEEAIELAQAQSIAAADVHILVDYVFGRPIGQTMQEVGGVAVTLNAFCEAAALSLVACEAVEIARINAKPVDHFKRRQQEKVKAGLV